MEGCPILANPDENNVESAHVCESPIDDALIVFETERALLEARLNICRTKCPFYFDCDPEQMHQYNTNKQNRTLVANRKGFYPREKAKSMYPAYPAK
jgi:hypothetical protein